MFYMHLFVTTILIYSVIALNVRALLKCILKHILEQNKGRSHRCRFLQNVVWNRDRSRSLGHFNYFFSRQELPKGNSIIVYVQLKLPLIHNNI